jgi:hypothetical protein
VNDHSDERATKNKKGIQDVASSDSFQVLLEKNKALYNRLFLAGQDAARLAIATIKEL